ncbi:hypothetical protein GGR57DRAFT_116037 [Xylariaceae sp. FL1272]|nr:hypothetical protein GGR57DRAFT_116037 [Xylariaceae sp. FL1272]
MSRHGSDELPRRGLAADYYDMKVIPPMPMSDHGGRRPASPGRTTYNGMSQARLAYEPQTPLYPSQSLEVPESRARPRSLPPSRDARDRSRDRSRDRRRERGHNGHGDSDDSDDGRARTPVEQTRHFIDNAFTASTTGLGVGVLGALVGGLAAREAVDYTSRQHKGHHADADLKRKQLISTVVGAAVGALGANAVEKRIEVNRVRDDIKQEKWERKWRNTDADVIERREVVALPRDRGSRHRGDRKSWDDRDRGRGIEHEVDPDARSWKNVEDWLWDDGERSRGSRPRSSGQQSGSYRF